MLIFLSTLCFDYFHLIAFQNLNFKWLCNIFFIQEWKTPKNSFSSFNSFYMLIPLISCHICREFFLVFPWCVDFYLIDLVKKNFFSPQVISYSCLDFSCFVHRNIFIISGGLTFAYSFHHFIVIFCVSCLNYIGFILMHKILVLVFSFLSTSLYLLSLKLY